MTEIETLNLAPTKSEDHPIEKVPVKNGSRKKDKNSPRAKQGAGLNKIKQDELLKWTVFVEPETKNAALKAAAKAGLTVTDWVNSRIRESATAELTKKAQAPAKPEDMVADIVKQFADRLEAQQAATVEAQNELIREQGNQIAKLAETLTNQPVPPEPLTFKEMIFGRSKR